MYVIVSGKLYTLSTVNVLKVIGNIMFSNIIKSETEKHRDVRHNEFGQLTNFGRAKFVLQQNVKHGYN